MRQLLLSLIAGATAVQRTALVVPCYNEAERFKRDAFQELLESRSREELRLLFVNDGSKDETARVLGSFVEASTAAGHNVALLNLERNGGKAEAVRRGLVEALGDAENSFVGFWDCDLATPLTELQHLEVQLQEREELEMVFGSRIKLLGRKVQRTMYRHYLGRVFATLASITLNLGIYDTQCGAKLFRASQAAREVFRDPFKAPWIFDVEMIARFGRRLKKPLEHAIYEYPLHEWNELGGSNLKLKDQVSALYYLADIWYRFSSPWASWEPSPAKDEL